MGKTQQGPKNHLRWKLDIHNLFSVTVIQKLPFRNRFPSGVFQILEVLCYPLNISHLTGTRESEVRWTGISAREFKYDAGKVPVPVAVPVYA